MYPTGTTIFHPDKTWSGYTVFITPDADGVILIDMNGRVVKQWTDLSGAAGGPARILPGGSRDRRRRERRAAPGSAGARAARLGRQGSVALRPHRADSRAATAPRSGRRASITTGSVRVSRRATIAPGVAAGVTNAPTLVLTHSNVVNPQIADRRLEDDRLIEVSWDGKILWDWRASDHADEFGFSADARGVIRQGLGFNRARDSVRLAAHQRGGLRRTEPLVRRGRRALRAGQRHHQQPRSELHRDRRPQRQDRVADGPRLPRVGCAAQARADHRAAQPAHHSRRACRAPATCWSSTTAARPATASPIPAAPDGRDSLRRGTSRVVEVNPVTFEKVWEYAVAGQESYRFFSHYVSGAQRLANGNTMITEGADGRIFEVTAGGEIVWEYVSPYFTQNGTQQPRVSRLPRAV